MDLTITALLAQDGITNGAIYALLALAIVLVFAVTRVIFVPAGEFVTYGTLTLAALQVGKPPGTVGLLAGLAFAVGATELWNAAHRRAWQELPRRLGLYVAAPLAIAGVVYAAAPLKLALPLQIVLAV